eukprot:1161942-Pelagomonas_calceolata.AAC.11
MSLFCLYPAALPVEPSAGARVVWIHLHDLSGIHIEVSEYVMPAIAEKIKVWDIATGECKATLAGHHVDWVTSIAIANDLVISGSDDTSVRWALCGLGENKLLMPMILV